MIQLNLGFSESTAKNRPDPVRYRPRHSRIASNNVLTTAIALLSDNEIEMMDRRDLLDTVQIAQSVRPIADTKSISRFETNDLRRVVYLLRRCLRTQLDLLSAARGWEPCFR